MMTRRAIILTLMLTMQLGGCTSQPVTRNTPMPKTLLIEIRMDSEDQKHTYLHVDRNDMLHFAGGTMAAAGMTEPMLKITREQRRKLWQIIRDHDLFQTHSNQATGDVLTTWNIMLQADRSRHRFRWVTTTEHQAVHQGVQQLQTTLFQIYKDHRYPK